MFDRRDIADPGGLTVALDVCRASLKGKPAQVLDGLAGDQRGLLGWSKPGAVAAQGDHSQAGRKRSALASAVTSKQRRPEDRGLVTAVDVKPRQLPEQRLTCLSRSGLLLY